MQPKPITIKVSGNAEVSGLWQAASGPSACLVLAHGAGAGMTHRSMAAIADGLMDLGVATYDTSFPIWRKAADGPTVLPRRMQRFALLSPSPRA